MTIVSCPVCMTEIRPGEPTVDVSSEIAPPAEEADRFTMVAVHEHCASAEEAMAHGVWLPDEDYEHGDL